MLALELVLLAGLAFAVARLVWTVAMPVGPMGDWVPPRTASAVADHSAIGSFDPFFRNAGNGTTLPLSALALALVGTRVDRVSGRGSAIIASDDGKQASYLVGETVAPGVTLQAVAFDAVTLATAAGAETLFLDQSAGPAPVTPESAAIATVAGAPPARLAADILVTPRLRGTAITGYILAPKGSGAAFAAAGLQPGDVLISVDGAPVAAIGDPLVLARRLDAGGVVAAIERGGQRIDLRIGGR